MLRRRAHNEAAILKAMSPAFILKRPEYWNGGVIFASPHSGQIYPKSFVKTCRLSLSKLRKNEDIFIDRLFAPATRYGAPLLSACFPRCFVDVNRAEDEVPSEWLPHGARSSARAEIGLGVVPTVIAQGQDMYLSPLSQDIAQQRLQALYHPYHDQVRSLIATAKSTAGSALLIDCHSMPGFSISGQRRPDIILGDRYGVSCRAETIDRIEKSFIQRGYNVARNHPYAGGYVTSHYGRPNNGVEVLQIEINRELYVNTATLKPNKSYDEFKTNLEVIIKDIIENAAPDMAVAAQ